MALVTLYVEQQQFHTYDGTDHKVVDIKNAKTLFGPGKHYNEAFDWAVAKADEILDSATELGVYRSNFDTSQVLVPKADYADFLDLHSDSLINLVFAAINKKVADGDVKAYIQTPDTIRHFSEDKPAAPPVVHPHMTTRFGFSGQVILRTEQGEVVATPQAYLHLPFALYKHLTTVYA